IYDLATARELSRRFICGPLVVAGLRLSLSWRDAAKRQSNRAANCRPAFAGRRTPWFRARCTASSRFFLIAISFAGHFLLLRTGEEYHTRDERIETRITLHCTVKSCPLSFCHGRFVFVARRADRDDHARGFDFRERHDDFVDFHAAGTGRR